MPKRDSAGKRDCGDERKRTAKSSLHRMKTKQGIGDCGRPHAIKDVHGLVVKRFDLRSSFRGIQLGCEIIYLLVRL